MNINSKIEKLSKKPRNNPTKRDPFKKIEMLKLNRTRIRMLLEKGFTEKELAVFLGYDISTIRRWKRNKDFEKFINEAKRVADDIVEQSLFRSAVGYIKTDKTYELIENEETGNERIVLSKMTLREMPGNVNAIILWLTNRRRDEWQRNYKSPQNTKPNVILKMMDSNSASPSEQ